MRTETGERRSYVQLYMFLNGDIKAGVILQGETSVRNIAKRGREREEEIIKLTIALTRA